MIFRPYKGIVSDSLPTLSEEGSLYDCLNFAPSKLVKGRLEQTPYFRSYATLGQTNFWNGAASEQESSAAKVLGTIGVTISNGSYFFFITTQTVKSGTSSGVRIFYQTTVPSGESTLTGCLLVINNASALGVNLGSALDVVVEAGGSTFKYRKNGGAYTTGVAMSTTGVSIDGGNATLYFLATSGFNSGDTWSWTRTDASTNSLTVQTTRQIVWEQVGDVIYYISPDYMLMRIQPDPLYPVIVSAGYRPIYCNHIVSYTNHLIAGGYSKTAYASPYAAFQNTIGWSDRDDYDNFIATDTNEADSFTIKNSASCIGLAVLQQQLFVVMNNWLYTTAYLGLPTVFSFQQFARVNISYDYLSNQIVVGDNEVWIISPFEFLSFDGIKIVLRSPPVRRFLSLVSSGQAYPVCGGYDPYTRRYYFIQVINSILLVYDNELGVWYRRNISFTDVPYSVITPSYSGGGVVSLGGLNLSVKSEIIDWNTGTPINDSGSGASFTSPKITTQAFPQQQSKVQEVSGTYLTIETQSVSGTTKFSTGQYLQAKVGWYSTNTGAISGSATTDTNAIWNSTKPNGLVSYPRTFFRGLALEVTVSGTDGTKPPGQCYLYAVEALEVQKTATPR